MDNLWTPWRLEYIKDNRMKKGGEPCVFCELAKAPVDDQSLVLARGKTTYVVMNRFPYNSGHLLVVPYEHCADLKNLKPEVHHELLWFMGEGMSIISEQMRADGFNCGLNVGRLAGGGIPDHLHWHIVPRWQGDTNFLPILGETRTMPEYLSQTYGRLIDSFKKLSPK